MFSNTLKEKDLEFTSLLKVNTRCSITGIYGKNHGISFTKDEGKIIHHLRDLGKKS